MSKLMTMTIVIMGVLLMLNIAGFEPPFTGFTSTIVTQSSQGSQGDFINYSATNSKLSNVENSSLWIKILAILGLLATAGIVASIFTRSSPVEYVVAGLVTIIAGLLLIDMLWILSEFWRFGTPYNMIGMLIFAPLIGGYIYVIIEWWRFGQ